TLGESWTKNTGWLTTRDVCDWHGIECSEGDANVTGIWLGSNNLTGTLVAATFLWEMETIAAFDAHDNLLTGTVPDEVADLVALEYLDLSGNSLTGDVPSPLGAMESLRTLNLADNNFDSIGNDWGVDGTALEQLFLQDNDISGFLPTAWLQVNGSVFDRPITHLDASSSLFPALRTLRMSGNNIIQPAYQALQSTATWPQLSALDLRNNALNGTLDGIFDVLYCAD
ncbi:unnamed protein product, partial [Phaeothamnion confervicola]